MLAHREDVQYQILVEFTHLLGPDAVIDGEAFRKKFTLLLADYLTHARKLVHRSERALFDSASTALAAEERPEPWLLHLGDRDAITRNHGTPFTLAGNLPGWKFTKKHNGGGSSQDILPYQPVQSSQRFHRSKT